MAKRGRKKQPKVSIDIAVVGMIIASLLLAILIYTKSGFLGETLSPMLGGIMGIIKYIIPIGTFAIAIYLAYDKKDYLYTKLLQYGVFLICIAVIMSVFQISAGTISMSGDFGKIMDQAYYYGARDIGGGIIGTVIATPLINLLGTLGTIILSLGVAIIILVFMFAIKPSEIIARIIDSMVERKEERREERRALKQEARNDRDERYQKGEKYIRDDRYENDERYARDARRLRGSTIRDIEEQEIVPEKKETARERRLREKEEERRKALEIDEDQITINLNGLDEKSGLKKYNHDADDLNPIGMENKASSPNEIEANLFKQEQEVKEEKVKEVLNLEHTMTVEEENENYEYPPIEILSQGEKRELKGGKKTVTDTATKLQKTLYSFGVSAKVENVSIGPAITRYELKPAEGVRVSKIANLADDIALNLAAESIRIEAPIPGKQAVGIEIPNKENEIVHFRDIIDTDEFRNHKSKLAFGLGKDVAGKEVVADIAKMPHVLIAGATGSGKSVCINTLISSIIYKAKPSEVKLLMVDPKIVELSVYNGIPHLLIPVVTDPKKAAGALAWAVQEMENRYNTFAQKGVRDLKGYNQEIESEGGIGKLPHIVIIIDELADLMMVASKMLTIQYVG